jgi:hypothetical protein
MRVNTGLTVSVSANTERWLSELRAGRAFGGSAQSTAVAANFSHVQLFNPVGSLITIIARLATVSLAATQNVGIGIYNTALTTLSGNGLNLLSGGAAAVGEVRTQVNGAALGTFIYLLDLAANDPKDFAAEWLLELGAGEGMIITGGVVNISVRGSFLWMEV